VAISGIFYYKYDEQYYVVHPTLPFLGGIKGVIQVLMPLIRVVISEIMIGKTKIRCMDSILGNYPTLE